MKNELGAISGIAETDDPNPLGEIWSCGWFFTQSRHNCFGFVWQNGQKRPLATLGGYNSFATGTNNQLQTVGWAETNVPESSCVAPQVLQFLAVIWGPGVDDVQPLPPLGDDKASAATAINDEGQVVGISGDCDRAFGRFSAKHAVLWENGVPVEIGDLGGEPGKIIDLGALGDDPYSEALGINEDRQVVGVSYSEGFACRAFLWEHGVMTDLSDLRPGYSGRLCVANDINDLGRITGEAIQEGTGQSVAFLATPLTHGASVNGMAARPASINQAPEGSWSLPRNVMLRSGVRPEGLRR